jgi:hypothetical protein
LAIRKTRLRGGCADRGGLDEAARSGIAAALQTARRLAAVPGGMRRHVFTMLMLTVLVLVVAGCGGGRY